MTISGAVYREGIAFSPDGAMYVTPTGTASITGGTITGTNVPYEWAKWGAPIVFAPTGTMGNNGAATWGTALPNAYTGGFWVVLPAGAIAAGVPGATAIYWAVGITITTATVYNSTIDLTSPGTPGTTTAFVTTGPGAFTGVTAQTTVFSKTLAASSLGINGRLKAQFLWSATNNANAKSANFNVGATDFFAAVSLASNGIVRQFEDIAVGPTQAKQVGTFWHMAGAGAFGSAANVYGAEDFSTALTVALKATRGTATDMLVLEAGEIVAAN